jgi:hypothetical protein
MKKHLFIAAAAALLLTGVSAASAAPILPAGLPAGETMAPPAHDSLHLTNAQQKTAWKDLYMKSLNEAAPSGFHLTAGAALPKAVATGRMTAKAAGDVPALKPYRFAVLEKKLLIVNPTDKKIAEVIAE